MRAAPNRIRPRSNGRSAPAPSRARPRWTRSAPPADVDAEQRIDMGALATELGISRATLYNWVGGRERLTAEVLWSFAELAITQARKEASGSGTGLRVPGDRALHDRAVGVRAHAPVHLA